jgi:hypothetical protein
MRGTFTAIATALAGRFAPAQVTPPSGYRNIRLATHALPNELPPLPCVLVFPEQGDFTSGNGTRTGTQDWTVRFYFDQASDLTRQSVALLDWLEVLTGQLRTSVTLTSTVDLANVMSWSAGILTYADQPYAGIELKVRTVSSEGWSASV